MKGVVIREACQSQLETGQKVELSPGVTLDEKHYAAFLPDPLPEVPSCRPGFPSILGIGKRRHSTLGWVI